MAACVDVTVIVPTYNRGRVLRQTLECVLQQEPAAREVIVVDQSDRPAADVDKFLEELVLAGKVRLIKQTKPNAERARNRGIREACGEVLLFLDDDVVMGEGLVGAHWRNYEDPEIAAVGGFYLEPGEVPLEKLPDEYFRRHTGWLYLPHCYTRRVESHLFPSCNGSIRRSVALRLGGFDENFTRTLLDDTDFSCRLRRLGVKAVHDPEAKLTHLKEPAGGMRPGGRNQFVIADMYLWYIWVYFFWMNFGSRSALELAIRFRRTVLRRVNLARPWHLAAALWHFVIGSLKAVRAMAGGRKLGWNPTPLTVAGVRE